MRAGNLHTPQMRTHMQSPPTETQTATFQRNAHPDKSLRCGHLDTDRNNETSTQHHANEDEKDYYQHTTAPPCPQHCNPHRHRTQHTDQRRHAPSALLHEHGRHIIRRQQHTTPPRSQQNKSTTCRTQHTNQQKHT